MVSDGPSRDDLVRTEYWQLMLDGRKDLARGDERKAADKFVRCLVDLSPTKWADERYNIFMYYGQYLWCNEDAVTEYDMQVLETELMNNPDEPMLFRCKAAVDLAFLKATKKDMKGSYEVARKALEFSEAMDMKERLMRFRAFRPDIGGRPVECFVQDLLKDLEPKLNDVRKFNKFHGSLEKVHSSKMEDFAEPHSLAAQLDVVVDSFDKFFPSRYMSFQSVIMHVGQKGYPDPDPRLDVVKRLEHQFINNEEEPMLFRCATACGLLQYHWNKGDRKTAFEYKKQARRFMRWAGRKELNTKVCCLRHFFDNQGSRPVEATVAEVFADLKEMYLGDEGPRQDEMTPYNNISSIEMRNIFRDENIEPATFSRRMIQGGDDCDFCERGKDELGLHRLEFCSQCKKAFYCSKECQRLAWKQGHKIACRAPDDIRPGDLMKPFGLKKESMNLRVVKVVREDPKKEGRWEVAFFDDETRNVLIAAEKLVHLRPLH